MKRMSVLIASALVLSILLMRAPVTCVGPVAESLRETLSVSYATYGVAVSYTHLTLPTIA